MAVSAVRNCSRSAAMFSVSGGDFKQSKSERAGLAMRVGRMHQWMCLVKTGKFVHPAAAVYLTAGVESALEELVAQCANAASAKNNNNQANSNGGGGVITVLLLEQVIASRGDLWGLFQPYAHLSSSRIASGTLVLSQCLESLLEPKGNQVRSMGYLLLSKIHILFYVFRPPTREDPAITVWVTAAAREACVKSC